MSSEDVQAKLLDRKQAVEQEFNLLSEERTKLIEQGKVLNQRMSAIGARQAQLQGAFQEIKTLLGEPEQKPLPDETETVSETEVEVVESDAKED